MTELDPFTIQEIELLEYQKNAFRKLYNVITWLFSGEYNFLPFKGFLLYGPPGTGKTEIAKQVSKKVAQAFPTVKIMFVDGADIASPKWGDAEKKLQSVFHVSEHEKKIIIFDDIECLMISRSASLAKEWHYSINSVLFHALDFIDPSKCIVISTTNRFDLVDEALKSRFYPIEIPYVPKEELYNLLENTLKKLELPDSVKVEIGSRIRKKIENREIIELRRVLQEITLSVFTYIAEGDIS
uniref:AAA family ATPase n=1 Tax=candidate division WOR-3 bacterium TaxID=2052148 RepID=A0A7C2K5F5_UNCW3